MCIVNNKMLKAMLHYWDAKKQNAHIIVHINFEFNQK